MGGTCPWCDAPRLGGIKCPKCGAIYAKAEALKAGADPAQVQEDGELELAPVAALAVVPPPQYRSEVLKPETPPWSGEIDDLELEWKLRLGAIPAALLLAALFHASAIGHFLQRTFLSMMVHEIGHAVTAWWCGFWAVPALWRTWIAPHRSLFLPSLGLAVANGYLVVLGARSRRYALAAAGAVSALLQVIGTLALPRSTAQAIITFGGDAGALVLGTGLMATFFFGRETQIYKGWLRWGFLVIGAAAFVDTFATWWAARSNFDAIPFGEMEGVGLSDPSKLIDVYGWTTRAMIHRYLALGISCAVALGAVWSWGVWQAWNEAQLKCTRG